MKNIFLLIFILFSLPVLGSGNYQTVYSNRTLLFETTGQNLIGLRIDSIKYQTDSIFYPNPNIQMKDYDCFIPDGASWIGEKIMIRNDGYNLFFNKDNDTIRIKTDAVMNDTWTAFVTKDSLIVKAGVVGFGFDEFLGIEDLVKTIQFQVYDIDMSPVQHQLNNMSIRISKNYGLIKTLNFYLFPDYNTNTYLSALNYFQELHIAGITNPEIGVQNLRWQDVHDYQPGDEIHVLYRSSQVNINENTGSTFIRKTINRYLQRTDYSDSIVYVLERKRGEQNLSSGMPTSYNYSLDTLITVIKPDDKFDKLPGESVIVYQPYYIYSYSMKNSLPLNKTKPSSYDIPMNYNDQELCWSIPLIHGCYPEYTYLKGLGGPYYECGQFEIEYSIKNELVYYKKGATTWGSPLKITGIKEVLPAINISVYPNPTKNYLVIECNVNDLPFTFELYDLTGKKVKSFMINYEKFEINISDLISSQYIFKITNKNKIFHSGKLVVQ